MDNTSAQYGAETRDRNGARDARFPFRADVARSGQDESGMLRAFARLVAVEIAAILRPETKPPYTSDPRALNLPPGWSKRQWDDRGRMREDDPRRPPLRKDPRGYSCAVETFDAWATTRKAKPRTAAPKQETADERRARRLANLGLRKAS